MEESKGVEIMLKLEGHDKDISTMKNLKRWIQKNMEEEIHIKTPDNDVAEWMGADVDTILKIILGSAAMVQLVKTIQIWINATRPNVKIKLERGNKKLEISSQNYPTEEEIVAKALSLWKDEEK